MQLQSKTQAYGTKRQSLTQVLSQIYHLDSLNRDNTGSNFAAI